MVNGRGDIKILLERHRPQVVDADIGGGGGGGVTWAPWAEKMLSIPMARSAMEERMPPWVTPAGLLIHSNGWKARVQLLAAQSTVTRRGASMALKPPRSLLIVLVISSWMACSIPA